jgi:hypothetical protein
MKFGPPADFDSPLHQSSELVRPLAVGSLLEEDRSGLGESQDVD